MSSPTREYGRLGFVGGTGPEGRGLALRFAQAGHPVAIGSRSGPRANEAAEEIRSELASADASGGSNEEVVNQADLVFLTIPYGAVRDTLPGLTTALKGKIVVSTIAPIEFRDGRPVALRVEARSAAEEVQSALPESRVVSGFQTVDAYRLQNLDQSLDTDVIVCSDDVEARRAIVQLAGGIQGIRALSGGRLAASRYVEECTALLITLNRIYKSHSGIHFTGIDR
jgi:NADPH-dependent F420 reductase